MRGRGSDQCLVLDFRDRMPEDEKLALDLLLGSGVPYESMSTALRNHGYKISYQTLRRHVKRLCRCA